MRRCLFLLSLFCIMMISPARAYVPLLDEVEGIPGNSGHYLILPAWENLDSSNKTHAYFIMPKYLVLGGNIDGSQPEYQFGVSHRGYTLFTNSTADYPPSMDLLATVQVFKDDTEINKIQQKLTERDTQAGLLAPVFPEPVFEKFEGSAIVAGAASPTALDTFAGGYPGQLTLVHVTAPPDVLPSLILDLPTSAGREAALWGVVLKGTMPGYGNRLNCTISIHHRKVYEHFKAQASGQAYWGLVKASLGTEMKKMDQDQSIDFGLCRGSPDQIEKIVMPVWLKIVELADQDGTKMFAEMVKSTSGIPGHPEANDFGWGFQASAGWEQVSYSDSTTINFNIAYRTSWQLPLVMTFSTQCTKWKTYFINNTNNAKPCVNSSDFPAIRDKQRACFSNYLQVIQTYPTEIRPDAYKRLRVMGCAWDGSWDSNALVNDLAMVQTADDAEDGRLCRSQYLGLLVKWRDDRNVSDEPYAALLQAVGTYGCAWRGGLTLLKVQRKDPASEVEATRRGFADRLKTLVSSR